MTKIIVFSGKKQSGKDSSADYVADKLLKMGKSVKRIAFADPLKKFCMDVLGLTKEQCNGTDEEKDSVTKWKWDDVDPDIRIRYSNETEEYTEGTFDVLKCSPVKKHRKVPRSGFMTAREAMQCFGTDVMREKFNKNIWAIGALNAADNSDADYVFFTDGRFPNEIDIGNKRDAITIRLHRTNYPRNDEHLSETSLDDYPVENYSYYIEAENLTELYSAMDNIMIQEDIVEREQENAPEQTSPFIVLPSGLNFR